MIVSLVIFFLLTHTKAKFFLETEVKTSSEKGWSIRVERPFGISTVQQRGRFMKIEGNSNMIYFNT